MQIAASKKTVYGFDHPAKGYACLLVVDRLAPDGYSWHLSDSLQRGKINLSALVDSDGCLVNNINYGGDGFFIKEDRDGLCLFFGQERVYLD